MRTLLACAITSLALTTVACGGDDDDGGGTSIDAPAATTTATVVDCTGVTPAATITAPGFAYTPNAVTITSGQVVKFTMPASHDAKSRTPGLFHVMFNQEQCLRFDGAGRVEFFCVPHQFTGTITVQ